MAAYCLVLGKNPSDYRTAKLKDIKIINVVHEAVRTKAKQEVAAQRILQEMRRR